MLSSESDSDIELSQNKTCGICKIKLTMKCLYCNLCDKLVCLPCLDMNTKLFDVLNNTKTSSSAVMIVCKHCRDKSFKVIKKHINDGKQQKDTTDMMNAMVNKFDKINVAVDERLQKLENLNKKILNESKIKDVMRDSYAEAIKNNATKNKHDHEEMKGAIKQAMEEKQEEDKSREKIVNKNSTLFIYYLKEDSLTDIEERIESERKAVDKFITEGIKIRPLEIKTTQRMGKYQSDKSRPIKVTFADKYAVGKIFKNIANLKQAEHDFKKIQVERELTKAEREQRYKKIKEVHAKNEKNEDTTKYYILRGTPQQPEIRAVAARQTEKQ